MLPVPTEHAEQAALFVWSQMAEARYPELRYLYAVPNGARTSMSVAKRLKAEGLRRGVPDIALDVPRANYHGLRIELKRKKKGKVSPEQMAWGQQLRANGYYWDVCLGWEAARALLLHYLNLPPCK